MTINALAEKPEERSVQVKGAFIFLSPSAAGDSGLNQFFGDYTHNISKLQGKRLFYTDAHN